MQRANKSQSSLENGGSNKLSKTHSQMENLVLPTLVFEHENSTNLFYIDCNGLD